MTDLVTRDPFGFTRDPFRDFFKGFGRDTATLLASAEERLSEAKQVLNKVNKTVTDDVLTLETDLPGVKKEDLSVKLEDLAAGGTRVTVVGKRADAEVKFTVTLKELLNASSAAAELSDGVLRITAPVLPSPVLNITEVKVT
jgi:HSP20 family molecular chaperone IbpA